MSNRHLRQRSRSTCHNRTVCLATVGLTTLEPRRRSSQRSVSTSILTVDLTLFLMRTTMTSTFASVLAATTTLSALPMRLFLPAIELLLVYSLSTSSSLTSFNAMKEIVSDVDNLSDSLKVTDKLAIARGHAKKRSRAAKSQWIAAVETMSMDAP